MPKTPVSDPQYLQKLRDYYARHHVFPSYAAIAKLVGLKSTSSVAALIGRLQAEGFLDAKDRRLRPGPRFFERALMQSRVAAGLPAAAFDAPAEALDIDALLVPHPSKTFLLTVKGESMTGAGLLPGDTLVVEQSATAKVGDIVVALVDESYTVKRLAREHRKLVLAAENDAFPTLRPETLEIVGVVIGSFRRYR